MDELKQDVKAIRSDVGEMKIDVAAMKVDVAHHVKRSDAADRRLEKLEYTLIGLLITVIGAAVVKWLIS